MFAAFVPFCFSIVVVSVFASKALHLYIHANAIPPLDFLLYLPSLLLPDLIAVCLARLLLRKEPGALAITGCIFGCLFAALLLGAVSSQLGFFYETGNEIEWSDAKSFANEEGLNVLLSGSAAVITCGAIVALVSWFLKGFLYRIVGNFVVTVGAHVALIWRRVTPCLRSKRGYNEDSDRLLADDDLPRDSSDADIERDAERATSPYGQEEAKSRPRAPPIIRRKIVWAALGAGVLFLVLTTSLRPEVPYSHVAVTLPILLLDVFQEGADYCTAQARLIGNKWPLPALTEVSRWELPRGNFKGWAPGADNEFVKAYRSHRPDWLPNPVPRGFFKWDPEAFHDELHHNDHSKDEAQNKHNDKVFEQCPGLVQNDTFYNPVNDPLKITNLGTDLLEPLQSVMKEKNVKIRHVVVILMESMREELFPLVQGSPFHELIMDNIPEDEREELNSRLAGLTPNIEKLTGKAGNFTTSDGIIIQAPETNWTDNSGEGFGGINVNGGLTPSSVSTKSLAALHCGVWPMPVNKFEEAETEAYQACLPQVLDLFNQLKPNTTSEDDYREYPWTSAFFQAVTDGYDRQSRFDTKIGFETVVNKKTLAKDAKNDKSLQEINYFGYPETGLKPHMSEFIDNVIEKKQRMFMSHFTSTTHHPWGLPNWFNSTDYMKLDGNLGWHKDFNKYLNTIHFTDNWLGEMMQMLDDKGISDETLVIFVGDHGQAFKEDTSKTGTYENGHVSNFRVPITIRHPRLPRVQYEANATSISILPTILDLLINTNSLNEKDTAAATELVQDYEGQSLIRPYKKSFNGRRAWNFGIINGGGGMLSITSADSPWRLVMPLDKEIEYRLTDLVNDPLEKNHLSDWSIKKLAKTAKKKHGEEAATWVLEAEQVAQWWGLERKRLWGYSF